MRLPAALLLALLPASLLYASPDLLVDVEPEARVTSRILFVVDCSGSMKGEKWRAACSAVLSIAEQPVDELEVGCVAFAESARRWDCPDGSGWLSLPSEDGLRALGSWLADQGAEGGTRVLPALRLALSAPEDRVTVALVSDGVWQSEGTEEVLAAVRVLQERREQPALLLAYTVGPGEQEGMTALGRLGRGGAYRERARHGQPLWLPPVPPGVQGQHR